MRCAVWAPRTVAFDRDFKPPIDSRARLPNVTRGGGETRDFRIVTALTTRDRHDERNNVFLFFFTLFNFLPPPFISYYCCCLKASTNLLFCLLVLWFPHSSAHCYRHSNFFVLPRFVSLGRRPLPLFPFIIPPVMFPQCFYMPFT